LSHRAAAWVGSLTIALSVKAGGDSVDADPLVHGALGLRSLQRTAPSAGITLAAACYSRSGSAGESS
jgi:hypothetical protein